MCYFLGMKKFLAFTLFSISISSFAFLILVEFLTTPEVYAAQIITDSSVVVDKNITYYENLYIGSGRSNILGTINSDLTIFSGETIITGKITDDVFVAGGDVDFLGEVDGDLRIVAGRVNVSGTITGDLVILGGDVFVSDKTTILNDTIIVGGKVDFLANSNEKLKIVASDVLINGYVGGETEVTTQKLSLGSNAVIDGIFSYFAPQKFKEGTGAQIIGTVNYNKINTIKDMGIIKKSAVNFLNFWLLLRFITTLIISFILIYIFRVFSVEVSHIVFKSFWKSLLTGIIIMILLPILIVFLLITLVAMPVGFLLSLAFVAFLLISPAVVGISLGAWVRKIFAKNTDYMIDFRSAGIGVVVYTALQFVPIIGDLLRLVLVIVAFGAMARYIRILIVK